MLAVIELTGLFVYTCMFHHFHVLYVFWMFQNGQALARSWQKPRKPGFLNVLHQHVFILMH